MRYSSFSPVSPKGLTGDVPMVRLLSGTGKALCSQPKPRQRGRYKNDIEDNVILQQIKSELS